MVEGKLTRMVGLALAAVGCRAAVGDRCQVLRDSGVPIDTEVVGFSGDDLFLMPIGEIRGLAPNAPVLPTSRGGLVAVGDGLLGRVLDGTGRPIDGAPAPITNQTRPLAGRTLNPLDRTPIDAALDVGVRAINALLTVGRGQRIGLFAGSGLGKSMLLRMMTRFTQADVIVVALIGERSREVNEFLHDILGPRGMERAVVVAAPADDPPLARLHGALLATAVAEHFRDQGLQVLLLMDSLTRFAQAQREIALAIGEPPATRGYPPAVFARIPQLVERAGVGEGGNGAITAVYTVLTEVDDGSDPIAEAARAILGGHVVLSRELAERNHFPAIDVEHSISRVMPQIVDASHYKLAGRFRNLWATYQHHADLISVGAYTEGSDAHTDEAIAMRPKQLDYLHQDSATPVSLEESVGALASLFEPEPMASKEATE